MQYLMIGSTGLIGRKYNLILDNRLIFIISVNKFRKTLISENSQFMFRLIISIANR